MLLLQEFEFDIQHWPGTQHAVVDYLSRIENGADEVDGDDDFPDGAILHIEAEDLEQTHAPHEDRWLTEMSTFLSTGLPPPRMRTPPCLRPQPRCPKPSRVQLQQGNLQPNQSSP